MKALYLDMAEPAELSLDGPSVVLRQEGWAARRFPLRLVSRVVVRGRLALELAAVEALLERGVAITVLGRDGKTAGQALPWPKGARRLMNRVEAFLASPGWRDRYRTWLRAAERREVLGLGRRLGVRFADLRAETVRREVLQALPTAGLEGLLSETEAILAAAAAESFAKSGLEPGASDRADGFRPVQDVTRLMLWQAYADLAEFQEKRGGEMECGSPDFRRALTDWMEGVRPSLRSRAGRLVDSFQGALGEAP